jgi:hypothetical protein
MAMNEDRRWLRLVGAAACVLLSASGCKRDQRGTGSSANAASTTLTVIEAQDLPKGGDASGASAPLRVVFGARGAGVAYVAQRGGAMHVVHNGRLGRAVTTVDQIALSPDGKRIAYSAQVEGSWRMVLDDALGVPSSSAGEPVFSPDGRHVAYQANSDVGSRMVVDGAASPVRPAFMGPPVFSADSTLVAYAEIPAEGQKARLIVSDLSFGEQRVKCGGVTRFLANEDRTAIAAVVEDPKQQRVLVFEFSQESSAARGPPYDLVSTPAFGRDGVSLAYVAERGGERFLVLDGREEPLPDGSVSGPPVIRPGNEGVGVIMTSRDGYRLHEGFARSEAGGGKPYEEAAELAYSNDGRSNAYCARRGQSWFVVVDGREGPSFDRVVSPAFSPDGKHLVYRARKEGKRFVVVADTNGRTIRLHPDYEQVFPVRFTVDGKSMTYGVKDGRQLTFKVEAL